MDSILHTIESGLKVDKDIYHTCKVYFWQLKIGKYPMGWVIRALIPVHINLYLGLPLEVTYIVIKPPFQRELCFPPTTYIPRCNWLSEIESCPPSLSPRGNTLLLPW